MHSILFSYQSIHIDTKRSKILLDNAAQILLFNLFSMYIPLSLLELIFIPINSIIKNNQPQEVE